MADELAARRRILYLTHRVPYPPNRGDRIRSFHTLQYLAARAEIDLACFSDEPVDPAASAVLAKLCRRTAIIPLGRRSRWVHAASSMMCGRSATEGLFHSRQMSAVLDRWAESAHYDFALAFCSSMATYLTLPRLRQIPQVVDLVDVDSQKWFDYAATASSATRWLFRMEGRRVRKLECEIAERSKAVVVVSEPEAELMRSFCSTAPLHAVSNGVDLDHFRPQADDDSIAIENQSNDRKIRPATANLQTGKIGKTNAATLVFVGVLDYRANIDGLVWFCREVWPQVLARYPAAKFQMVGRRPVSQVQKLAELPGVELIGEVPDVLPYLHQAAIVVAPLRIARGIQNKVLEALSAGKAVVASPQALEGLNLTPGSQVVAADQPAQWIAAIDCLLNDETERRRLGAAGREFVCQHHHWNSCLAPLGRLLETESTVLERGIHAGV
ncbi:MAG TPA: glycosyltransferase [Pirellulales bacterium]